MWKHQPEFQTIRFIGQEKEHKKTQVDFGVGADAIEVSSASESDSSFKKADMGTEYSRIMLCSKEKTAISGKTKRNGITSLGSLSSKYLPSSSFWQSSIRYLSTPHICLYII